MALASVYGFNDPRGFIRLHGGLAGGLGDVNVPVVVELATEGSVRIGWQAELPPSI